MAKLALNSSVVPLNCSCIVCKLVLKSSMTTSTASTMAILLIFRGSQLMYPHADQLPRPFKVRIRKLIPAPAINPRGGIWVLPIRRLLPFTIEVTKLTHNRITTKVKHPYSNSLVPSDDCTKCQLAQL